MVDSETSSQSTLKWKSLQWPAVITFLAIMALGACIGFSWLGYVTRFQTSHCPPDTFMVGMTTSCVIVIPEMVLSIGLSGTIVLLLLRIIPAIPRVLDRYEATSEKIYFHRI